MESAYDRKFKEMKKYIPFLESMIKRLESTNSTSANPRQAQLDKIRSLRDLLLDKKKRMKMENLLKCEQVLVNLYAKVEQRDACSEITPSTDMDTSAKESADLEAVRIKLKSVAKVQEGAETLPEIARANDFELHYTGSKEPALFQRRPNISSKSPARSAQQSPNETNTNSPQSQHRRSYTRVLVSPDQSPRRWSSSEQSSDKPLFSRRSPTRVPAPLVLGTKKEKKKSSKASKSRKTKDLNITLNVPEESLNSLNTKDILSRIINCSDGDVDIDTLRELRSQILGELKQTGKNDDISDLILKSYKKKANKPRSTLMDDVEEGELSDSESEAIESIYGSLVVMDKDKKSSTLVKTIEDKDSRKIQICLVINSDKDETNASNKESKQIIDLSEFEMFSDSEENKGKDVISIDSDTTSSSPQKAYKPIGENSQPNKHADSSAPGQKHSIEKVNDVINIVEDDELNKKLAKVTSNLEERNLQAFCDSINSSDNSNGEGDVSHKLCVSSDVTQIQNIIDLEQNENTEIAQEKSVEQRTFTANFYKPIDDHQGSEPVDSSASNLPEITTTPGNKIVTSEKQATPTEDFVPNKTDDEDDSQKIPLLNEPTVPPKAKTDVLSEIDILQALKNEILSETIAVPGSELVTPALHQPKLTKVANSQEVQQKKRISIEKYKQKASTSASRPLFVKRRNNMSQEDNKKQSLKLTEKECERFFSKRPSFDDDDDDDDLSDDDFLTEDKDDSLGLDDIYGDFAPKSPENEHVVTNESATPMIIPTDPVKTTAVSPRIDIDMRTLLPMLSPQAQPVPSPVIPPLIPPMGFGAMFPHNMDRSTSESNIEQLKKVAEQNRIKTMDPRIRRDLNSSAKESPNPYAATNSDRLLRSAPYPNIRHSAPNMTPSRTPNMTPSMTPNMTPSYMPSIPPLMMTPNARAFEMTPSHQSIESEESSVRKHVYAPSFSISDVRERESVPKEPHWEANRNDSRSRKSRWEDDRIPQAVGPKWEDRAPRSNSGQTEAPVTPRYDDTYKSKYEKYNNRIRNDQYNVDRRDSYSKTDCPTTPIPSFGWSECPSTPSSAFGRLEAPMTPSHPFGNSDCPSTLSHSFGRTDCPTTPIHTFGRADCPTPCSAFGRLDSSMTPTHQFSRSECPGTPSHSFGRSECPPTPSHLFGRSDCPSTPSHPFGRSEVLPFGRSDGSNNSSSQKYNKDPRLNRRPTECESSSYNDRDRGSQSERSHNRKSSSYKSQSKHYSNTDTPRNRERENSVGRSDRKYSVDRGMRHDDRREPSLGRSLSKDSESDSLYTRNRESRYDGRNSKSRDDGETRRDQREKSIGRMPDNKPGSERARSTSRALSVGRSLSKDQNKDSITLKSNVGRDLTINTSVNTTFQDFLASGKPIQLFDYTFDAKRQRATSVGRSLVRENSANRTLPIELKSNEMLTNNVNKNSKFKRASSVGRELGNTKKDMSFQEVKADFESYRSKLISKQIKETHKDKNRHNSRSKNDVDTTPQDYKTKKSKQSYSPRKNYRDPRMRKEHSVEHKSRYKIDRRFNRDPIKSGIIYSNDNIAKGTIMGSGFGVKNYKIPKIKRAVVENKEEANKEEANKEEANTEEANKEKANKEEANKVSSEEKTESTEISKSQKKKPAENEKDEKTKPKDTQKQKQKPVEDPVVSTKNKDLTTNKKPSNIIDDSERRVTRSLNKMDTKEVKEDELIIKTRKSKKSVKPVYYYSESDSGTESEVIEKKTKGTGSPNRKANKTKITTSSTLEKEVKKKSESPSLNSSFGMDDMEIFSENIGSDPVIENITALIANLDQDLDSSKISNDSFTELEKMMEDINSPEGNSLGDISEVIEKDLNESNEFQKQKLIADSTSINEKKEDINDLNTILQSVKPVLDTKTDLAEPQIVTKDVSEVAKPPVVEKPVDMDISLSGLGNQNLLDDTASSNVNEAIVSTTKIDQGSKLNDKIIETRERNAEKEDNYNPDSSINKNIIDKTVDSLPDSTNEIVCELSSDVTSTNEAVEISKKESEVQSTTEKEELKSFGSLLSILQDKTKMKELLSMLGDQSGEHDKIKKKLEKLSELVSDDEEEEENVNQRKVDYLKEALSDTKIDTKPIEKTASQNSLEVDADEQIGQKNDMEKSDEKNAVQNIEKIVQTVNSEGKNIQETVQLEKGDILFDNMENCKNKSVESNEEKIEEFEEKSTAYVANKTTTDSLTQNEYKNEKEKITEKKNNNQETKETKKYDDDMDEDGDTHDEPLINKKKNMTKKVKGKKTNGKFQKKKPITRAAPAKIQEKKPAARKKELQKLHDDIKEMSMSDDILNATGIRLCRLAKLVNENDNSKREDLPDSEPIVVLEKVKGIAKQNQPLKVRKKPGPKPKNKVGAPAPISQKSAGSDNTLDMKGNAPQTNIKMDKPKTLPKKPGPKSKTKQKSDEVDPYDFDAESVTDTTTTKESDEDSFDSENESLASSLSFGSSEVLADIKKKPKRKRRGTRGWQSGIIKPKNKKKKEQKQDAISDDSIIVKAQRDLITVPDLNCFTDKTYCFLKGVTTYDCRLCLYSGTDIVNHYKKEHPHTEIPLSRMDQQTAERAIMQCEEINFQAISKIPSDKYVCRFCCKEFSQYRIALETFFWHIVSHHTGEFKHLCSECVNVTRCPFNLDIPPPPKDGGQLIGYICGKCNFTQISLENLKTHVIVRHNDEQTEVYTINLAVISKKTMTAMLRRTGAKEPRVLRSLRSTPSAASVSYHEDRSDNRSDVSESSGRNSESDLGQLGTEEFQDEEKPKLSGRIKTILTFESEAPSDNTSVKLEDEEHDVMSHLNDSFNTETEDANIDTEPPRGMSDDIVDYPHFKLRYTDSGAKEYVCCINGNDYHYKTSLLISLKKHIQSKHSEKWDGYCCLCKVIVTLQGVHSDFKDCLSHFLDKHMDDFPVVEKQMEIAKEVLPAPFELPLPVPALSPALPARVATPPVERTASPSYIAVRPLAELISKELVKEIRTPIEEKTPITFPKIKNIASLNEATVPPSQRSPVYPTAVEPDSKPDKPFLYEEVQADVMSKKHRVVLDGMMVKENLVRVFKCAGRFCSFTSDSAEDALVHASTHQRVGGEGALNCAYCNYDASNNGIDLVMHVFREHSRCQYCCPLCFYRAAASRLVGVHHSKAHGDVVLKNVLRNKAVAAPAPGTSAGLLTRETAVQHFICQHEDGTCNFKTYTPGKFTEHLLLRHSTAARHPCNLCPNTFPSPAELVVHLRSHGLKLYQCTWCVHGANTEHEFLSHAASCHPGLQPQAYVRVITNKDGSSQLRVLPLANLSKSKVTTEDVAPNSTKENPVREAERSIELEKLIGHTMLMIEASDSQSSAPEDIKDQIQAEEPVELPPEHLSDSENETASALESLLTTTEKENSCETVLESLLVSKEKTVPLETSAELVSVPSDSEASFSLDTSQEQVLVKTEPAEVLKDLERDNIICLDSDDEESNATKEETPVNTNDDDTKSSEPEEDTVSGEVSRSTITDEVSITKVTDEVSSKGVSDDDSKLSIIDLSDDDPPTSNSPGSSIGPIVDLNLIYKCPKKVCGLICKSVNGLRKHTKACINLNNMICPHAPCAASISGFNRLIEHYMKVHKGSHKAPKIFCDICKNEFPTLSGAKVHVRVMHKVLKYTVTFGLDERGDQVTTVRDVGLEPPPPETPRISKRKISTEIQRYGITPARDQPEPPAKARKVSAESKKRYGIEDIDKLPISPILDAEVFCSLCSFGTKVRVNMVRHLLQHAGSLPVPRTQPVNPVPHLETNEKYFDRMVNLAASSAAARVPEPPPAAAAGDSPRYPRHVSARRRYTCGARGCSYISVDMAMFRFHWETLHVGDDDYRCVHCPPQQALDTSIPLSAARILAHLRMHDASLYACSACSYYHYRRHLVEKHLAETHEEGSVKVVREEGMARPATPPPTVGAPTMDLKAWQCGLCGFSSMLRAEVVNHCGVDHQSKMQFKCGYCPFRTSAVENVVKHQTNAHPGRVEEVFYYFYREGSIPDEDGVARWQKQRQKLGLDSEAEIKIEPEPTPSTRDEPDTVPPVSTPLSIDLNLVKKEVSDEPSPVSELSTEELCIQFGEFCEPDGIKYKCCLCSTVREHSKEAMQCHLYEELSYRRWECVMCMYRAFHKNGLNEHVTSEHSRQFVTPRALPVNLNIEKWVFKLLEYQSGIIEMNKKNLATQKIQVERPPAPPLPKKADSPKPSSSTSESELELTFGEFGTPENQQFSCPKCDFLTKAETDMVYHLETELTKIRWGCTHCDSKFQTFHEAQFHSKSHTGQSARPKETTRDPSVRSGWIAAVIATQKQFMKCVSGPELPERSAEEDSDSNENSLLVARYDEPLQTEEQLAALANRSLSDDSDEEPLIIDEPKKKMEKRCPHCDYKSTTSRCVKEHILRHFKIKPYKCPHCTCEGARITVQNHMEKYHPGSNMRIIAAKVPHGIPTDLVPAPSRKRELKEPDDGTKLVCLYCEKSVSPSETGSHVHGTENPEFGKRGEVVVKCCKCLALRLTVTSLQEHFDACHPNEKLNYAYFKLQIETREIHCCGHCYKKFKFLRDLKAHHKAIHTSLSLSFNSIPFSHNLHTEGDPESAKRKMEDTPEPPAKRIARKSTSKLPNSTVAKKSTTKLPFLTPEDVGEYSYYGSKPVPIEEYRDLTVLVPVNNKTVTVSVNKLRGILKIDPKVVVSDSDSKTTS